MIPIEENYIECENEPDWAIEGSHFNTYGTTKLASEAGTVSMLIQFQCDEAAPEWEYPNSFTLSPLFRLSIQHGREGINSPRGAGVKWADPTNPGIRRR